MKDEDDRLDPARGVVYAVEELMHSEQAIRVAKQKRVDAIAWTRTKLAKLDGERMLMGKAVVEVK